MNSQKKGLGCSTPLNRTNFVLHDKEQIQLFCRSNTGNSPTDLLWSNNGDIHLPKATVSLSSGMYEVNQILSTLTLTIDSRFDGVIFTCSRQSALFPSSDETCTLGPFSISSPMTMMTPQILTTLGGSPKTSDTVA